MTGQDLAPEPAPIPLRRRLPRQGRPGAAVAPFGRLVIVGNGMVSRRLCETLLQLGAGETLPEIVVFGEETRPAYDRVHLGEVLRGRSLESLLLAPPSWYLSNGILLHLGDQVEHIDRQAQLLISRRGQRLRYDRLVLATGAAPVAPPVIADRSDLMFLRTIEDVERLRVQAVAGRAAVVIGGGLLGVETAAGLREAGLAVTLVEIGQRLLRRQLDPVMAKALGQILVDRGIEVITGHALSTVVRQEGRKRIILAGGLELTADLIVVATGVRPRDELGGTELLRHVQGGYLVDEYLATSDPRIFAIGDCAVVLGRSPGTVLPGYEMADALAANLLGKARAFRAPAPAIRLKLPGTPLLLVGRCPEEGWTAIYSGKRGYRALLVENGQLQAAASLGAWPEWNRIEKAVVGHSPVTERELRRFTREGELPLGPPTYRSLPTVSKRSGSTGSTLPDVPISGDAIICTCNLVTAQTLLAAIGAGCRSMADVVSRTRAGSGCGSCAPAVRALLAGQQTTPLVRPLRPLAWAAAVALLLSLILPLARLPVLRPALPFAETWDFIGREPLVQQVTGFGVLGLFFLSLLLPLRRRAGNLLPGSPNLWRVVHGLVGVALCAGLLAHTSFRLGQGLNLAMSLTTLVLVVAGAVLGLVWRRAAPQSALSTRGLRPLHLLLFWPTLGLIVAHVLAVYYF